MAITFLSLSFTKTQDAPFSLMQVPAQALCPAFAPFAPQELSLIQPVQVIVLLSAMVARLSVANSTASKPNIPIALFMMVFLLRIVAGRAVRILPQTARFVTVRLRYSFQGWVGCYRRSNQLLPSSTFTLYSNCSPLDKAHLVNGLQKRYAPPTSTIGPVGCGMPPSGPMPGASFIIQWSVRPLTGLKTPALIGLPVTGTSQS